MDKIKLIKNHLEKEKHSLLTALKRARETRDSAPSAMESHHDTTRNQAEKFVVVLEGKLLMLEKSISGLPNPQDIKLSTAIALWSYVELNFNENEMKLIIVPEGLGGKKEDDINFISEKTPLANAVLNKRVNDSFILNGREGKILKIN